MPTTRFLFWNANRKPLERLVAKLASIHAVDVVILAENAASPATMLQAMNSDGAGFHFPAGNCPSITILTKFSRDYLTPLRESERVSIRKLELPARSPVLLVAVHFPSRLHWTGESLRDECVCLAREIEHVEGMAGHQRTILVGDFNMNPFESGMVSTMGLQSVTSRQVASRINRTVQGRNYGFFYNPMWHHFGDSSGGGGSYYYDAGQHVNYYWNMFDQVLLRPALAERFDPRSLEILKSVGPLSLVRPDGRPDKMVGSDHLPILFEVEF